MDDNETIKNGVVIFAIFSLSHIKHKAVSISIALNLDALA